MLGLSPSVVFQVLWHLLKAKHPKVQVSALFPLAIAQLESGATFNSNRAVRDGNIFGMKYPDKRPTAASGKTADGFAVFKSRLAALDDFMYWLEDRQLLTNEALVLHMKAGKYDPGNSRYYASWQPIVESLRPKMLDVASMLGKGVLGVLGVTGAVLAVKKASKS